MDTDELRRANDIAQRCFHEMLEAGVYGDPNAPATVRYVAMERLVDDLLRDAQWDRAKADLDAVIATDAA